MATTSATLFVTINPNPKPFNTHHFLRTRNSSLFLTAPQLPITVSAYKLTRDLNPSKSQNRRRSQLWRINAEATDAITKPLETAQEIVEARGDGTATVISGLLFVAFVGLSILTIGVVYLGVTDFLQKREREKFEKEEATKKNTEKKTKKRGKRQLMRPKPRGFGQKIEEDDDDDDI